MEDDGMIAFPRRPETRDYEAVGVTCWVAQAIGGGCDVILGVFEDTFPGRSAAARLAYDHKDDECVINSCGNEQVCTRLVKVTRGTFTEAVVQFDREHDRGYLIGTPYMGYSGSE